jgi:hypothetical protein
MTAATIVSGLLIAYFGCGALFAAAFVGRLDEFDPAAAGSSVWFRLAIVPGAATFWPLLFGRMIAGRSRKTEHTAGRREATP